MLTPEVCFHAEQAESGRKLPNLSNSKLSFSLSLSLDRISDVGHGESHACEL